MNDARNLARIRNIVGTCCMPPGLERRFTRSLIIVKREIQGEDRVSAICGCELWEQWFAVRSDAGGNAVLWRLTSAR